MWPILLEKAWAKVIGTYELTEGGFQIEGHAFLTNAPGKRNSITNLNAIATW